MNYSIDIAYSAATGDQELRPFYFDYSFMRDVTPVKAKAPPYEDCDELQFPTDRQ